MFRLVVLFSINLYGTQYSFCSVVIVSTVVLEDFECILRLVFSSNFSSPFLSTLFRTSFSLGSHRIIGVILITATTLRRDRVLFVAIATVHGLI